MKRPLVIGYGNTLREDDGIGWRAAELVEMLAVPGTVDIIQCQELMPELVSQVSAASVVVFLDAALDQEVGSVRLHRVRASGSSTWSHHLSPSQLLQLAQDFSGVAPPAVLIAGGISRTDRRECLSPGGKRLAADVAAAVLDVVSRLSGRWDVSKKRICAQKRLILSCF